MPAHAFERGLELAVTVDQMVGHVAASWRTSRTPAATPRMRAAGPGPRQLEQQFVGVASPVLLRPARELPPGEQPGLVVVGAEVGRARMRMSIAMIGIRAWW